MKFPDKLKLGKFPQPAKTGALNKKLAKAQGMIIFLYDENGLDTYAHGKVRCIDYMASIQKLITMAGCLRMEGKKEAEFIV